MDARFRRVATHTAQHHSVISSAQLERFGVDANLRHGWVTQGLLQRIGTHAYTIAGSVPTWERHLAAGMADVGRRAFVAGRSAARLYGLDGFTTDAVEFLARRPFRMLVSSCAVRSTRREIPTSDLRTVDGFRVLSPERLILDAPIFRFSPEEIENAIDSAIRARLVVESRLVARALERPTQGVRGGRMVLDALIDVGGESRLERRFLRLVREAKLPRPITQRVHRVNGRHLARVDFEFPNRLIVEVEGHAWHSSRRQRQRDEQRRTELTLRGSDVVVFTHADVFGRPEWVADCLRRAGIRRTA